MNAGGGVLLPNLEADLRRAAKVQVLADTFAGLDFLDGDATLAADIAALTPDAYFVDMAAELGLRPPSTETITAVRRALAARAADHRRHPDPFEGF